MPVRSIGPQLRRPPAKAAVYPTPAVPLPPKESTQEIDPTIAALLAQEQKLKVSVVALQAEITTLENKKITLLLTGDHPVVKVLKVEDEETPHGVFATLSVAGQPPTEIVLASTYEVARKFLQKAKKSSWGKHS